MKTARGTLRTPQRTDQTRQPRKLRGPACCRDCGAIYRRGRWRWEAIPAAPRATQCPACSRVRARLPGAGVTLRGEFLAAHRDEILARVRACERAENRTHPLQRIVAVGGGGKELRIGTTDVHLARRIESALRRVCKDENLLEVSWWK
jgi:hypothetical protein